MINCEYADYSLSKYINETIQEINKTIDVACKILNEQQKVYIAIYGKIEIFCLHPKNKYCTCTCIHMKDLLKTNRSVFKLLREANNYLKRQVPFMMYCRKCKITREFIVPYCKDIVPRVLPTIKHNILQPLVIQLRNELLPIIRE